MIVMAKGIFVIRCVLNFCDVTVEACYGIPLSSILAPSVRVILLFRASGSLAISIVVLTFPQGMSYTSKVAIHEWLEGQPRRFAQALTEQPANRNPTRTSKQAAISSNTTMVSPRKKKKASQQDEDLASIQTSRPLGEGQQDEVSSLALIEVSGD